MTGNVRIQQVLIKRGNTAAASAYTGPLGELLIDTGLKTLRIQDGATPGGGGGGYSGGGGAYAATQPVTDGGGAGGSWVAANAIAIATHTGTFNGSATFGGLTVTTIGSLNAGPGYVTITRIS